MVFDAVFHIKHFRKLSLVIPYHVRATAVEYVLPSTELGLHLVQDRTVSPLLSAWKHYQQWMKSTVQIACVPTLIWLIL